MRAVLSILRRRLLMLRRAAWERFFTLFVLAPVIVLGAAYIVEPTLERAAGWARTLILAHPGGPVAFSMLLLAVLAALGLPAALREIYSLDPADAYLEALPITRPARLVISLATLLVRNVALVLAAWLLFVLLSRGGEPYRFDLGASAALLALLAVLQAAGALAVVHLRLFRPAGVVGILAVIGAGAAAAALSADAAEWLRACGPGVALAEGQVRIAVGAPATEPSTVSSFAPVALGLAAILGFLRLRDDDRERARQLIRRRRRLRLAFAAKLTSRLGPEASAQFLRDLRLAARRFPRAVPVAAAAAVVLLAGAAVGAGQIGAESIWAARLLLAGVTFAALSLSAIAPLALAEQLPYLWVEKASGAPPDSIWQSKLSFSAILALVPALAALPLAAPYEEGAFGLLLFGLQAVACSLMGGLAIGAAAFETVDDPFVGMVLAGLLSTACAGLLICFPAFFVLVIALWVYLMQYLVGFAAARCAQLGTSG